VLPPVQHRRLKSILCPLVQPNKAVGLESHIGSWLAGYLEPTLLCLRSFTSRRSSHHRIMKLSDQNGQWVQSRSRSARQADSRGRTSSGLDASRINSPHKGARGDFSLDILSHRITYCDASASAQIDALEVIDQPGMEAAPLRRWEKRGSSAVRLSGNSHGRITRAGRPGPSG
jgi:hypothetical protein